MRLSANAPKYVRLGLNIALGIAFLWELLMPEAPTPVCQWLITLAAVASIAALHKQLPLQNVLLAAVVTALIGGIAHGLSASFGLSIPFGPIVFNAATSGEKVFNTVPWTIPLLWIAIVFSARGVARLILRPWRKTRSYGWWLMGLTATLMPAFDVALEPFATQTKHFWHWRPTKIELNWQGASPMDFLAWFFVTLLILLFITPSLIKKQPGSTSTPDYHPLIVWVGALLLFAIGSARNGIWLPVGIDACIAAITLILAVRGGRW